MRERGEKNAQVSYKLSNSTLCIKNEHTFKGGIKFYSHNFTFHDL